MNRRDFIATSIPAITLAACSGGATLTPAQIVTDVQNAVSALANSEAQVIAQFPNAIPSTTQGTITSALANAASVLGSLSSSLTATQSAPVIQKVEQAINTVITAAASVPLIPPPFSTALSAAAVVLPVIEAWLNSVLPAPAGASPAAMAARAKFANGMSVDAARASLATMAGR